MSLVAEKPLTRVTTPPNSDPTVLSPSRVAVWAYSFAVIAGLLMLDVFGELSYLIASSLLALAAFATIGLADRSRKALVHLRVDRRDLSMVAVTYLVVVVLYRIAFQVIEGQDMLLFLFFALGMMAGVAGPVIYTVWVRRRALATLGLSTSNLPRIALFALIFAGVQFSVTFLGYDGLPGMKDVVTLGVMALVVGVFESIFFRGFIQDRLQHSFGVAPAVFGAALLYGAYHVGYGMGFDEILFLSGLGIIYALAYATTENVLVMWPLLTPVGSLFAQFEGGDLVGRLPWAALLGWADVAALMIVLLLIARRHARSLGLRSVE